MRTAFRSLSLAAVFGAVAAASFAADYEVAGSYTTDLVINATEDSTVRLNGASFHDCQLKLTGNVTFTLELAEGTENEFLVDGEINDVNCAAIKATQGSGIIIDGTGKLKLEASKKMSDDKGILVCSNLTVRGGSTSVTLDCNKPDSSCIYLKGSYLQTGGKLSVDLKKKNSTNEFYGVSLSGKNTEFTMAGGEFKAEISGTGSRAVDLRKMSCVSTFRGGVCKALFEGPGGSFVHGGTVVIEDGKFNFTTNITAKMTSQYYPSGVSAVKADYSITVSGGTFKADLPLEGSEVFVTAAGSGGSIDVSGGNFSLVSSGDCFDADGDIAIAGGDIRAYALDAGSRAFNVGNGASGGEKQTLTISGGVVVATDGPGTVKTGTAESDEVGAVDFIQPTYYDTFPSASDYRGECLLLEGVTNGVPFTLEPQLPALAEGSFNLLVSVPGRAADEPRLKPELYAVAFDANGGTATEEGTVIADGSEIGELPSATRTGYKFLGWFTAVSGGSPVTAATKVVSEVTFYAHWQAVRYAVNYENTMGAANPNVTSYTVEDLIEFAPLPDVGRQHFAGWSKTGIARGTTGDVFVSANWEDLIPRIAPGRNLPMNTGVANTYDGVIADAEGLPVGTINVKTQKISRSGECKTTVTVQMAGVTKKVSVKGVVSGSGLSATTTDGRALELAFTRDGVSGSFGGYEIDGARNLVATSARTPEAKADKSAAEALVNRFKGNYVVAFGSGDGWNGLSVQILTKGKVKVSGVLADGTSVSATSQMIVGGDCCCIPVVYTRKSVSLAFSIYIRNASGEMSVIGCDDAVISRVSELGRGLSFKADESIKELFSGYELAYGFLPYGVSVEPEGRKWVVAGGAKPGRVKYVDGQIIEAKESGNASGLKLTYTARTGVFKGSFKVYAVDSRNKLKTFSATVSGIVVNGCGYGTAKIRKVGSIPVVID